MPGPNDAGAFPRATSTRFFEVTVIAAFASPVSFDGGSLSVAPLESRNWLSAQTEPTVVTSLRLTKPGRLSKRPRAALNLSAVLFRLPSQALEFGTPPVATMYIWVAAWAPQAGAGMEKLPFASVVAWPQSPATPAP